MLYFPTAERVQNRRPHMHKTLPHIGVRLQQMSRHIFSNIVYGQCTKFTAKSRLTPGQVIPESYLPWLKVTCPEIILIGELRPTGPRRIEAGQWTSSPRLFLKFISELLCFPACAA